MNKIGRIIAVVIFVLSLIVGAFPFFLGSPLFYTLYFLTFLLCVVSLFCRLKYKNEETRRRRLDMVLVAIILFMFVGVIFRENSEFLYAVAFSCILSSYYALSVIGVSDKLIKRLAYLVVIMLIPTIVFNGFLNLGLEANTAFSGRLNPLFYFPYILIMLKSINNKKKLLYWLLIIETILIIVDLWWSGSRIAMASVIVVLIVLFIYDKKKFIVTKKIKRTLKAFLGIIIVFHVVYPVAYVGLSENYSKELNEYSLNITSKDFFSGRQLIWKQIFKAMEQESNKLLGTGDVNYVNIWHHNPHNDFMGIYYSWGIVVAVMVYLFIFRIGSKCIKNMNSRSDLIIVISFIAYLLCCSNEAIMYAPHFFIFETILVANLLGKGDDKWLQDKN